MKPQLPLRLTPIPSRSYATRLPERPPYRAPDPLKNNPHAKYEALSERLTFIRRPPPTAPTPFSYTTSPSSPLLRQSPSLPVSRVSLPPSLHPDKPQPSRMSDEDIATMRKLRAEDPSKWTRSLLAKKFNCTPQIARSAGSQRPSLRKTRRPQEYLPRLRRRTSPGPSPAAATLKTNPITTYPATM